MTRDVLHVLGTARPEGASIARMVGLLGQGMDPARYRLHAWFLDGDGPLRSELEDCGVGTRSVPWSRGAASICGMIRFWRELRRGKFALIHQHYGGRSVRLVTRLASSAPIACHVWGAVDESRPYERLRIERKICDCVVACSRSVADQIVGAVPKVIYAGVKPLGHAPTARSDRQELVVGAASRMVPSKGLGTLLSAAALLQTRFPRVRFEFAGDGPDRKSLEDRARRSGLANVSFLGWRGDIEAVLPRWDIFVQPSLQEPLGIANLEAMREGIPIVASRTGGIPEVVVDGETGILVSPGDAGELAQALERLLLDGAMRLRMGDAGRVRAQRVFSRDAVAAQVAMLYDEMLFKR